MPSLSQDHPCSSAFLERYRIECRRHLRTTMDGSHVTRRRGQSIEFREFAPYTPGDDVRHIDWLASARVGGGRLLTPAAPWLVRRYMAEEQLRLVISIDMRPSMGLPQPAPRGRGVPPTVSKFQVAAWLAEAIAWIALTTEDQVVLHSLFGSGCQPPLGQVNRHHIRSRLHDLAAQPHSSLPNLASLQRYLPPTAVWVILTDCYFSTPAAQSLARRIAQAQDGARWVILVDLNNWHYERAMIENSIGAGEIAQVEGPDLERSQACDLNATHLRLVEQEIENHKRQFRGLCARLDYDEWVWGVEVPDAMQFFVDHFAADTKLMRLFMKDT